MHVKNFLFENKEIVSFYLARFLKYVVKNSFLKNLNRGFLLRNKTKLHLVKGTFENFVQNRLNSHLLIS